MSPTALEEQRFVRVAPTWEAARPDPEPPAPQTSSSRRLRVGLAIAAGLGLISATLVVLAVLAGFALGLPMGSGVGERTPRPQSAAALAGGFELGAGQLRLDLRDVAFPRGTTRTQVDVGFGQALVIVPRGVEVVVDGRVLAGNARAFGLQEDGIGVDRTRASGAGPGAPRLEIDARVGFGELHVVRAS